MTWILIAILTNAGTVSGNYNMTMHRFETFEQCSVAKRAVENMDTVMMRQYVECFQIPSAQKDIESTGNNKNAAGAVVPLPE